MTHEISIFVKILLKFEKYLLAWIKQNLMKTHLQTDPHLPKNIFIWLNDNPSKMMKNAFYFILKARFVLKIIKCLSWIFGNAEKTAWLERFKVKRITNNSTNPCSILAKFRTSFFSPFSSLIMKKNKIQVLQ